MKHTPAPWTFLVNSTGVTFGIYGSNDAWIADVNGHLRFLDIETAQANAELIARAPELIEENESLKSINKELLEALENIMKLIDEKQLVRNIEDDSKEGWAMRQFTLVSNLKKAMTLIDKSKL